MQALGPLCPHTGTGASTQHLQLILLLSDRCVNIVLHLLCFTFIHHLQKSDLSLIFLVISIYNNNKANKRLIFLAQYRISLSIPLITEIDHLK